MTKHCVRDLSAKIIGVDSKEEEMVGGKGPLAREQKRMNTLVRVREKDSLIENGVIT